MSSPKISVITVGMNHLRFIMNLYKTLLVDNRPTCKFECIYVDNCSTDNSLLWLKDNYPEVITIANSKPLGFGENNNLGVKVSRGEYIAIINPDIEFIDGAIDSLVQWMDNNKGEFGIVGPKLLNPDRTVQFSARKFITPKIFISRLFSAGNDASHNRKVEEYLCINIDQNKIQPVNWIMGAAMFTSRAFYGSLGGFDEDYFLYMEDEDLCLRSWKKGMPVIYAGNVAVIHNHLRSSKKIGRTMFYHFKSLALFFKKHGCRIDNYVK